MRHAIPTKRYMLERDPDLFLKPLADAFFECTANAQAIPKRNALFFYAAKAAAIARLIALDRIILEFETFSKEPHTMERRFEEDQLLYGFFTNALSAIESFCFAAYFLGTALKKSDFEPEPKLWRTNPERTLCCYRNLYSNSPFTKALRRCIWSEQYASIRAIRNMLSHRFSPGRIISASTRPGFVDPPDLWNLELWFEGGSSNRETGVGKPQIRNFPIESKSLIELRNWSDQQLELLGKNLQNLAISKGLSQK
jgi:hypothetical protein